MKRWVRVHNRSRGNTLLGRARWCDSFSCRLRGLTFRRDIPDGEGLVLVERSEGRINTSIHMLFVFFSISVFWVSSEGVVVDKTLARPWGFYAPKQAAQFIFEASPRILDEVQIGDQLEFLDEE
ncbi:MAG: DUF192 domain-containing protein [Anaerolineales bacterium]|jgi:uncharacterized membrane protein (UPF0127 family)|nr:DUF192 domain-containing protein [Anaerolineales bacterium]